MESTDKVVLHWRWPALFIQGSITKRTSLLFVSFLVAYICWSNLYASITIGVAILASVLILCETIPVELCALVRPCFALESAMACRVFRVVFLGVMEDTQEDTSRSTTSNPHHCDVANYKRGRPPKF
jgi:hypothetical protein